MVSHECAHARTPCTGAACKGERVCRAERSSSSTMFGDTVRRGGVRAVKLRSEPIQAGTRRDASPSPSRARAWACAPLSANAHAHAHAHALSRAARRAARAVRACAGEPRQDHRHRPTCELAARSPSEVGRAGIARARRRGSWASLAAVAVCGAGGVRECNVAARVGWEAWADSSTDLPLVTGSTSRKKDLYFFTTRQNINTSAPSPARNYKGTSLQMTHEEERSPPLESRLGHTHTCPAGQPSRQRDEHDPAAARPGSSKDTRHTSHD